MPSLEQIDSHSPAVRAIERWKRGLVVTILAALGLLPGLVAGAVALFLVEMIADETAGVAAGVFAFIVVAPWAMGQRRFIRHIGKLAEAADD